MNLLTDKRWKLKIYVYIFKILIIFTEYEEWSVVCRLFIASLYKFLYKNFITRNLNSFNGFMIFFFLRRHYYGTKEWRFLFLLKQGKSKTETTCNWSIRKWNRKKVSIMIIIILYVNYAVCCKAKQKCSKATASAWTFAYYHLR